MKTAIVYFSAHHGNTKKLADAIAEKNEICLIDAAKQKSADLSAYDLIGFASGIAYGKFYPQILQFMEENLPENKKVFLLYTYGTKRSSYTDAAGAIISARHCETVGEYGCPGFDTYGPLKIIGGIAKGHPTAEEIAGAAAFYDSLIKTMNKTKENESRKPANAAEPPEKAPLKSEALAQVAGGAEVKGSEPIQVEPFSTWEIFPTIDP